MIDLLFTGKCQRCKQNFNPGAEESAGLLLRRQQDASSLLLWSVVLVRSAIYLGLKTVRTGDFATAADLSDHQPGIRGCIFTLQHHQPFGSGMHHTDQSNSVSIWSLLGTCVMYLCGDGVAMKNFWGRGGVWS